MINSKSKVSVILPVMYGDPWQEDLARFAILTLRAKTDIPFELVIVETESDTLGDLSDQHLVCPNRTCYTKDFNAGLRLAKGDLVVHTGIDVIPGQGWLEAMLECFDEFKDCGVATISMGEPGAMIGPYMPQDTFDESMYGPFMMFRAGWFLDPLFPGMGGDNDLVMRIYNEGFRAYRNNNVKGFHMNGITWQTAYTQEDRDEITKKAQSDFHARHGKSPLAMYRMMMRGRNEYAKEYW